RDRAPAVYGARRRSDFRAPQRPGDGIGQASGIARAGRALCPTLQPQSCRRGRELMAAAPFGLTAWRWLGMAATPLAPLLLSERAARGKEERARMQERLGEASRPRPEGRVIWVHGASVGESLAAL